MNRTPLMAAKAEAWPGVFLFLLGTCPAQGKRCQSLPSVLGNAAKLCVQGDLGCRMLCSLAAFAGCCDRLGSNAKEVGLAVLLNTFGGHDR